MTVISLDGLPSSERALVPVSPARAVVLELAGLNDLELLEIFRSQPPGSPRRAAARAARRLRPEDLQQLQVIKSGKLQDHRSGRGNRNQCTLRRGQSIQADHCHARLGSSQSENYGLPGGGAVR